MRLTGRGPGRFRQEEETLREKITGGVFCGPSLKGLENLMVDFDTNTHRHGDCLSLRLIQ